MSDLYKAKEANDFNAERADEVAKIMNKYASYQREWWLEIALSEAFNRGAVAEAANRHK